MNTVEIINGQHYPFVSSNRVAKRKLRCGIGINDAPFTTVVHVNGNRMVHPIYKIWASMISRAYSQTVHAALPTYSGVTVCDDWHTFTRFHKWCQSQDWENKELDKDILEIGNRIYSPDKCVFVTGAINTLLVNGHSSERALPQGVCWDKGRGKYKAQISINGVTKCIKRTTSIQDAEAAYLLVKACHIANESKKEKDPRIKKGLLRWSTYFMNAHASCAGRM